MQTAISPQTATRASDDANSWPVFLRRQARELYGFRTMLRNLITSEIRFRYHGSVLGFFWALLNPLLFMVVISIFFAMVLRVDVIDYAAFVFSGKIPWTFVQGVMLSSPVVFRSAEGYLKRVYVPKIAFPVARVCVELINFLLVFAAFYMLQLALGLRVTPAIVFLPLAIGFITVFLLGLCLIISICSVYFHDLHHIMHVLDSVLIYTMPLIYHIEAIPEQYRFIFYFHPFYYFIKVFRAVVYEGRPPLLIEWLPSLVIAFVTLGIGLALMKRREFDLVFRL